MVFHVGKYSRKKMEKTPDSGWGMKKLGWWLNQPILKNMLVKLDHVLPQLGMKTPKISETTT